MKPSHAPGTVRSAAAHLGRFAAQLRAWVRGTRVGRWLAMRHDDALCAMAMHEEAVHYGEDEVAPVWELFLYVDTFLGLGGHLAHAQAITIDASAAAWRAICRRRTEFVSAHPKGRGHSGASR